MPGPYNSSSRLPFIRSAEVPAYRSRSFRIQRAVEQAFRLPCRYSYRHSPKNVGTDADVAT
jgi:hypothetical protein